MVSRDLQRRRISNMIIDHQHPNQVSSLLLVIQKVAIMLYIFEIDLLYQLHRYTSLTKQWT